MSITATNVTAGKPKSTGSVFTAPVGTSLPTNALDALTGYTELGAVSEEGMTKTISKSTTNIKEWGGGIVLITEDEKTATVKLKLIEYLNVDVQKFVNEDANVTGTSVTAGLKIVTNDKEASERIVVIDQIMRGGIPFRTVIPRAKITNVGDVVYRGNEAVAYDLTLTAVKDSNGDYIVEYMGGSAGT